MLTGTAFIVGAGLVAAVLLAIGVGIDAIGLVILGSLVVVGAAAVWIALRTKERRVSPATCPECGGLISPHAPHCKHCGALLSGPPD